MFRDLQGTDKLPVQNMYWTKVTALSTETYSNMIIICTLVSNQDKVFEYKDYVGDDDNPLVVISPAQSEVIRYLFSACQNLIHVKSHTLTKEHYYSGHPDEKLLSNNPLDPSYALFYQYGWQWLDLVSKGRHINNISPESVDLNEMTTDDRNQFMNPHNFWVRFICGMCGIEADLVKIKPEEHVSRHVRDFDIEVMMCFSADFRDKLLEQSIIALKAFGERVEGMEDADFHPLYIKKELGHIYDEYNPSDCIDARTAFMQHINSEDMDFTKPLELEWDGDFAAVDRFTAVFNDGVRLKAEKNHRGEVSSYYKKRLEGFQQKEASAWECNIFPASSLMALFVYLEKVHGVTVKKMFDPMAGWGDRLFAAASSGVEYHGNDSNGEMGSVYVDIMMSMSTLNLITLPITSYSVTNSRIETLDLSSKAEMYDLVFTSPPYFSLEMYGAGDTAVSVHGMSKEETRNAYKEWMKSFGSVFIGKSAHVLRKEGILGLHLSDFSLNEVYFPFKQDFVSLCVGIGLVQLKSWGYSYDGGRVREFLLFQKQ